MKNKYQPERKTYEVTYWSCENTKHRHRTKDIAIKCIEKSNAPKRVTNSWNDENLKEVLAQWRKGGMSKTALGKTYNVSCSQMMNLIKKAERIERQRRFNNEH